MQLLAFLRRIYKTSVYNLEVRTTRKNSIKHFAVPMWLFFVHSFFAVWGKDGDPNGVTELESADKVKVRCLSDVIKAKLKDSHRGKE